MGTILLVMGVQIGGFFLTGVAVHWFFYLRRRDTAAAWKHQPTRFQSRRDQWSKLPLVLLNGSLISFITGVGVHLSAQGHTRLVWSWAELGALGAALSFVGCVVFYHGALYYFHRWMHTPRMYQRFHRVHHRYKNPMFLDALYEHPLEALYGAFVITAPLWLFPVYAGSYFAFLALMGLHEVLDHAGVRLDLPLLSSSKAHDEHHRRFHGYYGQLLGLLDRVHHTDSPARPAPLWSGLRSRRASPGVAEGRQPERPVSVPQP